MDRFACSQAASSAAPRWSMPQRGRATFFPWAAPIPRESQESRPSRILRSATAGRGAAFNAIEAAMGAPRKQRSRRINMATIGTFKKSRAEFLGQIVTLNVQTKNVRITLEPAAPAGMRRAIGSSSASPRSAPPGRSAPRSSVTISRSSWTARASTLRSTRTSSKTRMAKASTSSGPAAARPTPIKTRRRPARVHRAGRILRTLEFPSAARSSAAVSQRRES
jgi:hypothetical protein